jgi:phytoene synthase
VTSGLQTQKFRETLRKGSKSFSFATHLFSRETRESVYYLYSWCRHCDDVTDGSILGFHQNPIGLEVNRVEHLKEMTHLGVREENPSIDTTFLAFGQVARKHQIPLVYADDLLIGMKRDAEAQKISNHADLLTYCYQVAGTVGLMMCHIMGLKDPRALKYAVDLGIALQMTNIARDIGDDYRVHKIYLPEDWLQEENIPATKLLEPEHALRLNFLVHRLLKEADHYYELGLRGLVDLPWRPALAVAVASSIYRAIGIEVLKLGPEARTQRVTLSLFQKFKALSWGISLLLKTIPDRIFFPRPISPISEIWRYS